MSELFDDQQLVAYWRPHGGLRHALHPTEPPRAGQERAALCGRAVEVGHPTAVDWLSPTCDACWRIATAARDRQSAHRAGER
ncbi:zinc finger protein [Saccharopolyspora griseoalba]|uniref:Zinc finger protein n=1 Tax=Saccharopolyspora griseoalba TaxID=1431848 RepID=A0ABW2LIP1_9PSEU